MSQDFTIEKASAALPSSGNSTIFTVSGGRVLVKLLAGTTTAAVTGGGTTYFRVYDGGGNQREQLHGAGLNGVGSGELFGYSTVGASLPVSGGSLLQSGHTIRVATSDVVSAGSASYIVVYEPIDQGAKITAA